MGRGPGRRHRRLGVLGLSVIWGLLLSSRLLGRWAQSAWLLDLHRWLGALSVIFTGVHVAGLVGDNWLHVGWAQVLVPQTSAWRPWAVTWGVVAFYLLIAVEASSLCRRFLPHRLWRRMHFAAFPLVVFASLHGAQAGTDATNWIYQAFSVALLAVILGLTLVRMAVGRRARRRAHQAGPETAPATPEPDANPNANANPNVAANVREMASPKN